MPASRPPSGRHALDRPLCPADPSRPALRAAPAIAAPSAETLSASDIGSARRRALAASVCFPYHPWVAVTLDDDEDTRPVLIDAPSEVLAAAAAKIAESQPWSPRLRRRRRPMPQEQRSGVAEADQALLHAACDALRMPAFFCRRGACHRHGRCSLATPDGWPLCLDDAEVLACKELLVYHRALFAYYPKFTDRYLTPPLSQLQEYIGRPLLGIFLRLGCAAAAAMLPRRHPLKAEMHAFFQRQDVAHAQQKARHRQALRTAQACAAAEGPSPPGADAHG